MKGILISLRDYVTHGWNMLRSSLIGIGIGILPGVGATIASIVAYTTAQERLEDAGACSAGAARKRSSRPRARTTPPPAAR